MITRIGQGKLACKAYMHECQNVDYRLCVLVEKVCKIRMSDLLLGRLTKQIANQSPKKHTLRHRIVRAQTISRLVQLVSSKLLARNIRGRELFKNNFYFGARLLELLEAESLLGIILGYAKYLKLRGPGAAATES